MTIFCMPACGLAHLLLYKLYIHGGICYIQVQMYAANQTLFFQDFTAAYLKLGLDGASFRR